MDHSQPASMQDVAKAASVSPQTVSRVANGSNAVRPETRQRVEAAMAKLGYRPNYAARALKHGKFKDVGVVLFNMLTYGNARILGGIADAANSNGYAITMQSFGRNRERTLHAAIERMKQLPVDGVIAVMEEHVTDFSEFRPPKELPVVIISEDPANYCPTHRCRPVRLLSRRRGLSAQQGAQDRLPHRRAVLVASRGKPRAGVA